MILSLQTTAPQFQNDIADVVRLFYGAIEIKNENAELRLVHTERAEGSFNVCAVLVEGPFTRRCERRYAYQADALSEKRLHKRAIKLAVYDALKSGTGRTPPWGSLTGVRPTRILYAEMEKGASLEEACKSSRAVFDISEAKIDVLCEIIKTQRALPPIGEREIDLYIGIPFCVTRCAYCSFLSGEIGKGEQVVPYVDALLFEVAAARRLIMELGLTVGAVYIGGGTPTALPAYELGRVLDAAAPFAKGREWTVEAGRPDTIDAEKLALIKEAGVTRISINPQTMHDQTLLLIGRAHTAKQTEQAYALAREMGFRHINMDLIAGLPGEDEAMFDQTLAWAKTLSPESLTVHTLSIKRSSLMHLWQTALPDGEMVSRMVESGRRAAHDMGMNAYYLYRQKYMAGNLENVGYTLPGQACRYNVHMMEETGSVLALGAGGISKRVYKEGGRIGRAPNVYNIGEYIARVGEMAERKRALWTDGVCSQM